LLKLTECTSWFVANGLHVPLHISCVLQVTWSTVIQSQLEKTGYSLETS